MNANTDPDELAQAIVNCLKFPGVAVPFCGGALIFKGCSPRELELSTGLKTLSAGDIPPVLKTRGARGKYRDAVTGKVDLAAIFDDEARESSLTSKPNI
jgi:hypothetical protein